jgi:NAD(P)-dependent dehydrogenase (short-subunit alcohol dehydrogenase family)
MPTALITGANRGIGLELARQLAQRGTEVIGVCRESSADLESLGVVVEAGVDITSDEDVDGLAGRLEGKKLDLLINNAGVLKRITLDEPNFFEECQRQFEVNALGALRVTRTLRTHLAAGAKVAVITSRLGSVSDNSSGAHYAYRMSKAALNMAGKSLSIDLAPRNVAVCILHPGFVRTGMTGGRGNLDAPDAAAGLLARIDELSLETTGGFWHSQGERLPW